MADNCSKYSTYRKQRRVVGASTWEDVLPVAYSIDGDGTMPLILIESGSSDCCGSDPDTGDTPSIGDIKWEVVTNNYYCDGTTKKQMLQKYQWNGTQWVALQEFVAGDVIEYESTDCGFIPSTGYSFTWQDGTTAKTVSIGSATTSDIYAVISTYDGLDHDYRVLSYPIWTDAIRDLNARTIRVSVGTNRNENDRTGTVVVQQLDSEDEITLSITQSGTGSTHDYSQDYFTTVALEDGTISFSGSSETNILSYSKDSGTTWTTMSGRQESVQVSTGDRVMWKGTPTPLSPNGIGKFSSTARYNAEGNVMSLLYGDNFQGQTDLTGTSYALHRLFSDCTNLVSVENLILPATTLAKNCYHHMFWGCTSLTTAPQLPATTLAQYCYYGMFTNCTNLTTAPELPATNLAVRCYESMFMGCTSLTTAPELPATTLTEGCYRLMFDGCDNLTTAPELPATTLASQCYNSMFFDCTSLTAAPVLSATTLTQGCYYCMFTGCINLSSVVCLATDISASNCTLYWLSRVAATGTFTKATSMSSWTTGTSGIPTGWTVQNA